jgi:biotin operon repressor
MGNINYAKIETSPRLQRALALLQDGHWHSTRAIVRTADVCAVNSIITELRCNGYDIVTRCVGRGRYEYQLIQAGQRGLF